MSERNRPEEPTIAPGLEDDELYANATEAEREAGDTTSVTTLSFDEHDNGSDNSQES